MTAPLTPLESRLASPDALNVREVYLARLQSLEARLRTHIASGLPRDQFPAWAAAAEAAHAAQDILAELPLHHASNPSGTPPAPTLSL